MLKIILLTLILSLIYACTTTTSIERTLSPELNLNKKYPIVLNVLSGRYGKEVSALMENALLEKGYHLIDRHNMVEGMIANAKIPAASYVISGNAEKFGHEKDIKTDQVLCSNANNQFYSTRYRETRSGTISAQIRISKTKTGQILLARNIEGQVSHTTVDDGCGSIRPIKPTPDELMEGARLAFRREFLKLIEPYYDRFEVELFKVSELPEMIEGNEFMKKQQLKEALSMYEKAVRKVVNMDISDKDKGHVFYSYGVALGYLGDERFKENIAKAMSYNAHTYAYELEMRRLIEIQPKIIKN